jgi:hypothetical protein
MQSPTHEKVERVALNALFGVEARTGRNSALRATRSTSANWPIA